jgi:hypothetical protein
VKPELIDGVLGLSLVGCVWYSEKDITGEAQVIQKGPTTTKAAVAAQ